MFVASIMSGVTLADSEAYFKGRVETLGLGDVWDEFESRGWTTAGAFAFASAYCPPQGMVDEAPFLTGVVQPLLGDPNSDRKLNVRRLYFESYTVYSADLKRRIDAGPEDDAPRRMLKEERELRRTATEKKCGGLQLELGPRRTWSRCEGTL